MPAAYLVRTCHNLGELALLLVLALDNGLDDGGMVGAQVDEDVPDAGLPESLEEGERCCVAEGMSILGTAGLAVGTHTILAVLKLSRLLSQWA